MGVYKAIRRLVVVPAYSSRIALRMKYDQTCFAVVLMHLFHKTIYTIVCKVSRGVSTTFIVWLYRQ